MIVQTWLQKEKKKEKEIKRNRKDDRMLIRSDLTLSNLVFCIQCEWTGKVPLEETEINCNHQGVVDTSFHPRPCKTEA
jgi:hypothetical protein